MPPSVHWFKCNLASSPQMEVRGSIPFQFVLNPNLKTTEQGWQSWWQSLLLERIQSSMRNHRKQCSPKDNQNFKYNKHQIEINSAHSSYTTHSSPSSKRKIWARIKPLQLQWSDESKVTTPEKTWVCKNSSVSYDLNCTPEDIYIWQVVNRYEINEPENDQWPEFPTKQFIGQRQAWENSDSPVNLCESTAKYTIPIDVRLRETHPDLVAQNKVKHNAPSTSNSLRSLRPLVLNPTAENCTKTWKNKMADF